MTSTALLRTPYVWARNILRPLSRAPVAQQTVLSSDQATICLLCTRALSEARSVCLIIADLNPRACERPCGNELPSVGAGRGCPRTTSFEHLLQESQSRLTLLANTPGCANSEITLQANCASEFDHAILIRCSPQQRLLTTSSHTSESQPAA